MITTPEQMREAANNDELSILSAMADAGTISDEGQVRLDLLNTRAIPIAPQPVADPDDLKPVAWRHRFTHDGVEMWGYSTTKMRDTDLPLYPAAQSHPAQQPVAVTVKPLVWREQSNTCQVADTPWGSVAVQDESHALCPHRWGWWMVGSDEDDSATGYGHNIELAKAAAQADYEARILSALTIHPADQLSDPRVVALVGLLARAKEELRMIRMKDTGAVYDILLRIEMDAALHAIGGEA